MSLLEKGKIHESGSALIEKMLRVPAAVLSTEL